MSTMAASAPPLLAARPALPSYQVFSLYHSLTKAGSCRLPTVL